jgi:hypothetical protein
VVEDGAARVSRFGRKLFQLNGAGEITGLHFIADVVVPMPEDRIPVDPELLRQGVEARAAGAQELDAPALIMAAYLASRTRDFLDCHVQKPVAKVARIAGGRYPVVTQILCGPLSLEAPRGSR